MEAMTDREQRVDQIRRAAIPVFASQGFKRTSMADLAEAAGVSRPALYQYFDNRADLFREALQIILVEATDAALEALGGDGLVAERIDGRVLLAARGEVSTSDSHPCPASRMSSLLLAFSVTSCLACTEHGMPLRAEARERRRLAHAPRHS